MANDRSEASAPGWLWLATFTAYLGGMAASASLLPFAWAETATGELLEGVGGGSGGEPWFRVRAVVAGALSWLPVGSTVFRSAVVVAMLHGLLAALLVARVARRLLPLASGAPRTVVLAGWLTALGVCTGPGVLAAAMAPSASSLGVVLSLLAWEAWERGRREGAALAWGLCLAADPWLAITLLPWIVWRLRSQPVPAPSRPTLLLALLAGALPGVLAVVPGRALATTEIRWPQGWDATHTGPGALLAEVGWPLLGFALLGALLAVWRRQRAYVLGVLWLLVPAALAVLLGGPSLAASPTLLVHVAVAELGIAFVLLGARALDDLRIPLAHASVVLVIVLLSAWPLARVDRAQERFESDASVRAAGELAITSSIAPGALVLVRDDDFERHLIAARVVGGVPSDVTVLPVRHPGSLRLRMQLLREPDLAQLVSDTLMNGEPSELALGKLAAARSVYVELPSTTSRALIKHVIPEGALARFDAEPRAVSDRRAALARESKLYDVMGGSAEPEHANPMLLRRVRRLAVLLAATGERDSAAAGVDALRTLAGDEPLVTELVRKWVLRGSAADYTDIDLDD